MIMDEFIMLKKHADYPPFIPMGLLGLKTQGSMLYKIGFFGNFQLNAKTSQVNQNNSGWSHFFGKSVTFEMP